MDLTKGKHNRTIFDWALILIFAITTLWMGVAQAAETPLKFKAVDLGGAWKGCVDKDNQGESLGYPETSFDDSQWREVAIPCNFDSLGPGMDEFRGNCWFRRSFVVSNSWRNQRVIIRFKGINNQGDIWLNGGKIGKSVDPFLPYELTIGDDIKYGCSNTLVVRVNNEDPVSGMPTFFGWRSEGGILRGVELIAGSFCYMNQVALTAEPVQDGGVLNITIKVNNKMVKAQSVQARIKIFDQGGGIVSEFATDWMKIKRDDYASLQSTVSLPGVKWWSPEHPNLYSAQIELAGKEGEIFQSRVERFGFRNIKTQGNQLLLNGKPVYLVGFNRHEDSYRTGMATDIALTRQDLTDMKRMGANFIRLCHYPHDPREIDICDELGLLVMCEIPYYMANLMPGSVDITQNENNVLVTESAKRQLTMMIERDRNHPSVIFWSVGNENKECLAEVRQLLGDLVLLAKKLDPSRLATHVTIQGFWDDPNIDTHHYDDVVGVNCYGYMNYGEKSKEYLERALGTVHRKYPGKPLLITEYGAWEIKRGQENEGQIQATAIENDFSFFICDPNICGAIIWCYADHRWPPKAFIPEADGISPYGVYKRDRTPAAAVKVVEKIFGQQLRERQHISNSSNLVLSCKSDNDFFQVLRTNGIDCQRYETPQEAVEMASENGGVMILADCYPQARTKLDEGVFQLARKKKMRLYVEYPSMVPGVELGETRYQQCGTYGSVRERTVVTSDFFAPHLEKNRILSISDCYLQQVKNVKPHLANAVVVGYDSVPLSVPENAAPILFSLDQGDVLVATTKLSNFVTGRYAPITAWRGVWQGILQWVCPKAPIAQLEWTPTVRPTLGPRDKLAADAEEQAMRRAAEWYKKSRLLVHESGRYWTPGDINASDKYRGIKPLPPDWQVGDGSYGILECYISKRIFAGGSQATHPCIRADCSLESAMGLACGSALFNNIEMRKIAENLNDYIYFRAPTSKYGRVDPASPSYGLLGHNDYDTYPSQFWGDDNARSILGSLASAALLKTDRWNEGIIRALLGNFRTTGPYGYRLTVLGESELQAKGWKYYWELPEKIFSPHYESWLWCCYLWAYEQTRFQPFLERARTGIQLMMEAYPDKWLAECGRMDEERIRMLLPLSWLGRVEDTIQHRQWLGAVCY